MQPYSFSAGICAQRTDRFGKLFVYNEVESVTGDRGERASQFVGRVDDAPAGKKQ